MKPTGPAGIERKALRELSQAHARVLVIALENWVFNFSSSTGEQYSTSPWVLDLYPYDDPLRKGKI